MFIPREVALYVDYKCPTLPSSPSTVTARVPPIGMLLVRHAAHASVDGSCRKVVLVPRVILRDAV